MTSPSSGVSVASADAAGAKQAGLAALAMFETLTLTLIESGALSPGNLIDALQDAKAAHTGAADQDSDRELHLNVAQLIERMVEQVNTLRVGPPLPDGQPDP